MHLCPPQWFYQRYWEIRRHRKLICSYLLILESVNHWIIFESVCYFVFFRFWTVLTAFFIYFFTIYNFKSLEWIIPYQGRRHTKRLQYISIYPQIEFPSGINIELQLNGNKSNISFVIRTWWAISQRKIRTTSFVCKHFISSQQMMEIVWLGFYSRPKVG